MSFFSLLRDDCVHVSSTFHRNFCYLCNNNDRDLLLIKSDDDNFNEKWPVNNKINDNYDQKMKSRYLPSVVTSCKNNPNTFNVIINKNVNLFFNKVKDHHKTLCVKSQNFIVNTLVGFLFYLLCFFIVYHH